MMVGQTGDGGEGNTQQKEGSRRWEGEAATSTGPEEQGEELLHICAVGRAQLSTVCSAECRADRQAGAALRAAVGETLQRSERAGAGRGGLGLTPAHNPPVPRGFTSAHRAVESSRAN